MQDGPMAHSSLKSNVKSFFPSTTYYCRCINNLWSLRKNCEVWTFWTPSPMGPSTGNQQLQNPITSRVSWFCSGVPIMDKSCVQTRIQVSSPFPLFHSRPRLRTGLQMTCICTPCSTPAITITEQPYSPPFDLLLTLQVAPTFTRFKPRMSTPPLLWACPSNL